MDKENSGLSEEDKKNLQEFLVANGYDILPELNDEGETKNTDDLDEKNGTDISEGEVKKASPKSIVKEKAELIGGLSKEALSDIKQFVENAEIGTYLERILQPHEANVRDISTFEQTNEKDPIAAIADEIQANVQKQIALEEERIRFEQIAKKEKDIAIGIGSKIKSAIKSYRGRSKKEDIPLTNTERLTTPKKRGIIGRLINRKRYESNSISVRALENAYLSGKISKEDVEQSKNGETWRDRELYRKVQNYEDAAEDIAIKRGWVSFKAGLLTVLLVASMNMAHRVEKEVQAWREDSHRVVTIHNANEEERTSAMTRILLLEESTEYEFEHLSNEELMDAALRIPVVERKIPEGYFRGAMNSMKDQELLDEILEKTYGDELNNFTSEQKRDLKQLAYEFLNDDVKGYYVRDPMVVEEIAKRQREISEEQELGEEIGDL